MEGFKKSHKVLVLGLLQSLHFLVAVRPNEILDGDEFARTRVSNGHGDGTIKLELVDLLKALRFTAVNWYLDPESLSLLREPTSAARPVAGSRIALLGVYPQIRIR